MQSTHVVVVDRHDLTRSGLQSILQEGDTAAKIVGVFDNLVAAETFLQNERVHLLLLDDRLPPTINIVDTVRRFSQQYPDVAIIILSDHLSMRYIQRLLAAMTSGFIYKRERLSRVLLTAIETVRYGRTYISPQAAALAYDRVEGQTEQLNTTDREVLQLIGRGHTVQEIVQLTGLVDHSVYRVRRKLRTLLDVRTNEQILEAARACGWLDESSL